MKKIGITGASGHIGANLVRKLLKENKTVRVLQYHDHLALDGLDLEIVRAELEDRDSLNSFCADLDVVIHLAAKISISNNSFDMLHKVNVEGTKNLVYAAKSAGVKRFIHFSSIHALTHDPLDQPMDESRPLSLNSKMPYERTKAMAEEWIRTQQEADFDVIIMYPTAILGPNDFKPSLVGQMLINLYNGSLPGLIRGGYDWVDVRDICEATYRAIYTAKGGGRYILSGSWKSIVHLAKLFAEVSGKDIHIPVFPLWLARIGIPFIHIYAFIKGQQPLYTGKSLTILQQGNKYISHAKAFGDLGFNPTPLEQSLKDTIAWFKENGKIK